MNLGHLKIKLFADGADLAGMKAMYANPAIKGFTTNPTLMRKAGIADYKAFALEVLKAIPDRPVSFEVFADELDQMEAQGREIATWGPNVNVKIPVTNTQRVFCGPVNTRLVLVTGILTLTLAPQVAISRPCASISSSSSAKTSKETGRSGIAFSTSRAKAL